jgi:hypothetical protein
MLAQGYGWGNVAIEGRRNGVEAALKVAALRSQ